MILLSSKPLSYRLVGSAGLRPFTLLGLRNEARATFFRKLLDFRAKDEVADASCPLLSDMTAESVTMPIVCAWVRFDKEFQCAHV